MCKIDLFNKLIFSNLKTPQHILDIGSINIINNSTKSIVQFKQIIV